MTTPKVVLNVTDLKKHFPVKRGLLRRTIGHVKAVDGISFHLAAGETLAIVGESGSGKSTLGRLILRLTTPDAGQIQVDGQDFLALKGPALKAARRGLQVIFQDPYASLNPRMSVREILREPLTTHGMGTASEQEARILALAAQVGLRPEALDRYPHEFSGGQRQRIGIARALALSPKVIIADEPVSALDVSVQSQVLNLIKDLQEALGLSFLFISHDLAVVQHISQRVAVLYKGKIVEEAPTGEIFASPLHPYTQTLLEAVPRPGRPRRSAAATAAHKASPPPQHGCSFYGRCPFGRDICQTEIPPLKSRGKSSPHFVACHLY